jgi:hypothetical protein
VLPRSRRGVQGSDGEEVQAQPENRVRHCVQGELRATSGAGVHAGHQAELH